MDKLHLRPATIDDVPFIARAILEAVGFENPSSEIIERQQSLCRRTDVLYSWRNTTIAQYDGKIAGSLTSYDGRHYRKMRAVTFPLIHEMCGADFSDMDDETGAGEFYLDSLYVQPEFRKQGIATALIRDGIDKAKHLRIQKVTLIVSPTKPAAANLYQAIGFHETRQQIAFHEQYIKMTLALAYPPLLEVCAASVNSALTAEKAGAPRIELCQRLDLGGLTPTHDDIRYCARKLNLRTFVLIRPRGGDFCYNEDEFELIVNDIRFCKSEGISGVVVGFLNSDLTINVEQCRRAIEAADGLEVTFHRAFDRCANWPMALEQIIDCGFNRILTSGQEPTAMQGLNTLKAIQKQAKGRIAILAGSGVNAGNARHILREVGNNEVHGSCKIAGYESDEAEVRKTLEELKTF
ncbi:MAG: GNAT family N-acetyltransferase [Bacteroidales bacterium]|nr:GNAT family N-acetyltransferase [Bacteroidales bacterium]